MLLVTKSVPSGKGDFYETLDVSRLATVSELRGTRWVQPTDLETKLTLCMKLSILDQSKVNMTVGEL